MTTFLNLIKRVFALINAVLLFFAGGVNGAFEKGAPQYISAHGVIGIETLTRAQGITNDGKNFIFSGKNSLEKTTADGRKILALNTNAIPEKIKNEYGISHIGGISCADGIVYAAAEDSKKWNHPMILLYDADTLEFTGTYFELPVSLHKRGAPWVAVDGEKGVAYTGDSRNYTEIYEWKLDGFSYIRTVELSDEVKKIQGGDCMDGILYVGTNDMTRSCQAINPQNGTAVKLFDRITYEYKLIDNFGGEGEDITVLPMEDGSFIHSLTIGAGFTDAWVKSYG